MTDLLEDYMTLFRRYSYFNDIPGNLSCFYIMGQMLKDYIRIPMDGLWIDPRVHVFWIQDTRSGKSIALDFIKDVCEGIYDVNAETLDVVNNAPPPSPENRVFTAMDSASDAGMVGSWRTDGDGNPQFTPGAIGGNGYYAIDEASVLVKERHYTQETPLILQKAMNPLDTASNVYTKTMAVGPDIVVTSRRSFWFTTYPPPNMIQSVLNTGIYQRVLTYARYIDSNFRRTVSKKRARGWFQRADIEQPKTELIERFKDIKRFFHENMLDYLNLTDEAFDELEPDDKAERMLNAAFHSVDIEDGWLQAIDFTIDSNYEYLETVRDEIKGVVESFVCNIENYTVIFSVLIAAMDERTTVTALDVRRAHRTIFPVFEQLIDWLSEEMKVERSAKRKATTVNRWVACYTECPKHNIPGIEGLVSAKSELVNAYMKMAGVSQATAYKHYNESVHLRFDETKAPQGRATYVRLKTDNGGSNG